MDLATTIGNIIGFVLGFVGVLGLLLMFPLLILGITLLVISTNRTDKSKKKLKFWGIISLVLSVGSVLIPMILWAILQTILAVH